MGYTHYFKQSRWTIKDKDGFLRSLPLIQEVIARHRSILQLEHDNDAEPEVTEKAIRFNGIGDDGHETFLVENKKSDFNFCKTARKPYDLPICEILLILKANCPNFELSSDGFCGRLGEDEVDGCWQAAMDSVKEHFGLAFTVEVTKKREPYYDWEPAFDGFVSAVKTAM